MQAGAVFASEGLDPDKDVKLLKAVSARHMYEYLSEGKGDAICCAVHRSLFLDASSTKGIFEHPLRTRTGKRLGRIF